MSEWRVGTVRVTNEYLCEVLKFPPGTRIIESKGCWRDVVLTVMHDAIPPLHHNSAALLELAPHWSIRDGETVFEGWQ